MSGDDVARERFRRLARRHEAPPGPPSGAPAVVARVYRQATLPTAAGAFFACHPVAVGGTEAEGAAGGLSVDTSTTLYVYVVGSGAPAEGDDLVARFVANRWVAERMAPGQPTFQGIKLTGCPCIMPGTLTMTPVTGTPSDANYTDTLTFGSKPVPDTSGWPADGTFFGSKVQVQHGSTFTFTYGGPGHWEWTGADTTSDHWQYLPVNWRWVYDGPVLIDVTTTTTDYLTFYELICAGGGSSYDLYFSTYQADGTVFSQTLAQRWRPGTTGNTCGPPVSLHNGQGFTGWPGGMQLDP